ncbi:sensor histidine kinase [Candidatus Enterococcus ferrettii]|uniref:histidine kinase n=1 Tax=Candidatus Enterococcus ferrettii TaxID=2815324 RepID=A0ABV0EN84_9ENTE|nr:sensor histidine kinase [Enterococcus sp. 665A]MBO1339073.1 two-component sensor histidine kinase [Enterococcus sp. 665A]
MDKPSNKWLSISLISILCLTIIGIVVTATTYRSTQKHALKMGTDQLIKINDFAINILTLEIESYSLSLEDYASNVFFDNTPLELSKTEQIEKSLSNKSSAIVGLYLLDTQGNLLDGKSFDKHTFEPQTEFPAFLKKDPSFSQALNGQVDQNGSSYFEKEKSYLNLYRVIKNNQNQPIALLVLPLDLEQLYLSTLDADDQFSGYTMIKNQDMKVVMHPSNEQISLSIVEDRQKKYPNLDYTDLERLEKTQLANSDGTMSYHSYWWDKKNPTRVLKLTAYRWITVGKAKWIVATNSDFYEQNGVAIQESLIILGLLCILLATILLLTFSLRSYSRRNQSYLENLRLLERQKLMNERHSLEKSMLQESKLETIGLLTTSIVHDMNNFLTPMIGNLELMIEEHQQNQALIDDLQEVYHAAERGQKLSTNVLRFSKLASNTKETVNITAAVAEAIETMRILIPKKVRLTFQQQATGNSCFEKEELQVILYNLLTNAYQARKANTVINVLVKRADEQESQQFQKHSLAYSTKDFALIQITDNGPGIPKEIEDKIFTPFFTTKTSSGGTGLGLFIVSSIIKKNDWLLSVTSSNAGTSFVIGIPLTDDTPTA